ncbi:UPF0716 protein FxsA [Bacillus sp. SORGH_AS 510]|uniref:FxsA family protein n=1 Tax=Bacillus sp. SORGH_AS_0510 TaxID=3041771 RepID=UPI002789BBF8|nr:FxsA family protein [Bacillus sp. SORGH_AS_0510]MDQ1144775.1 UPF0716 protein FxsA [Bacillus sp. SORGH_AS_0510]
MRYLFLLIIIVPTIDIGLLLLSGKTIGFWPTFAIILSTGVLGAYMAKREGMQTIKRAREQLQYGEIPGEAVLDGICIIIGGTLLITPGFVTDITGFLLLFPLTRQPFKYLLKTLWRRRIDKGNIKIIK